MGLCNSRKGEPKEGVGGPGPQGQQLDSELLGETYQKLFGGDQRPRGRKAVQRVIQTLKPLGLSVRSQILKLGEDWIFLFLLGICMATISFGLDVIISKFQRANLWVYDALEGYRALQYFSWVLYHAGLMMVSAGVAKYISPQAAGSGIPELKVTLRGVVLSEFFTLRTGLAKLVGVICTLGAGSTIFLGKVGPFVHMATILATQLGRVMVRVAGTKENPARKYEMLVAGAAVGVACCFVAPVGADHEGAAGDFLQQLHLGAGGAGGAERHPPAPPPLLRGPLAPVDPPPALLPRDAQLLPAHQGAGLGRLYGEIMAKVFPEGIVSDGIRIAIGPAAYALAGAAAYSGAVTHTLSTALLVFELTGQMSHVLPVLIAVLVANGLSQRLQAFKDVRGLLKVSNLKQFPLVDSQESRILLGSIRRKHLAKLLSEQLSTEKRFHCRGQTALRGPQRRSQERDTQLSVKMKDVRHLVEDWECQQLQEPVRLEDLPIDPAPYRLLEKETLYQCYDLFNLLGLRTAYVTNVGRLVGVVSLRELKAAVEGSVKGTFVRRRPHDGAQHEGDPDPNGASA
ncbi:mucin-3A [Platysternon megacephalum]|uniref:Mucin-3A n=1 Tax=Platysternon megacephalum TaxID=55544 RepID=A0A4D9DT97_9SAUR|nr:mucin-3A [Platysternon megacephalum]